jgi:cyclophilin family peptidyl-prolyl cis-trans isomerase/protein-disulfide isomerase
MRKSIVLVFLVLTLALGACQPAPTAAPAVEPTATLPIIPSATIDLTPSPTATTAATLEPTLAITKSDPATCSATPVIPTPDPNMVSYLPEVSENDWVTGPSDAVLTIVEYGDFQDANSARLSTILQDLLKKYPNDVRLVFRHFPLPEQYDKDELAAQAAEAAGLQGKFWQYHNLLFTYQSDWTSLSAEDFVNWAYEKAAELGLDADQFKQDMVSDAVIARVEDSRVVAVRMNMVYTNFYDPFLFFNGAAISMLYNLDSLSYVVDYYKLPEKSYTECPPMTVDPTKTYTATLHTEKGDIVIELYPDKAPWAVNSFVFLAQNGWYDGIAFFRVITGFVAQTGDPSNSGLGSPGYTFTDELDPTLHFDKPGVLAMANSGANTNGSQFFITYSAVPSLDGKYTIFGQVVSGMDVLNKLRPRNPSTDSILLPPDPIISITIEVK